MSRKRDNKDLPTYDELFIPTVEALKELGGSGSITEINTRVYEIANLPNEILDIPHGEDGSTSEVDYRLHWTRTYLKAFGIIDNSTRGIWSLIRPDVDIATLEPEEIKRVVKATLKSREKKAKAENEIVTKEEIEEEVEEKQGWKEQLLNVLYEVTPAAFERLAQRILRESGFFKVEVTGRAGDGGIDGKGIVSLNGFLSFHVIFQCKRYRGSITPDKIRDFRGAMQGRADKGLFITTGTFTREATKEATRDGAPPIDLIDGDLLCDKLRELKLGVIPKLTERIEVQKDWFGNL